MARIRSQRVIPRLLRVRQRFAGERLDSVSGVLGQQLQRLRPLIPAGASIAIATGGRGVANIAQIVKNTADLVREQGASPFIVPAMGSHGGATAEGQEAVLASYGITEDSVGAPVRSSMDVVELPQGDNVTGVFMDRRAWESDGVIVINRVKPHTDYHGPYESGLVKMSVIGLGKHRQAMEIHRFGVAGLRELIPRAAKQILATGKILGGIALVENAYDQTMDLRALRSEEIMSAEPELLDMARANMPALPSDHIDILVVDRMGKEISGAGIDTNIIGRLRIHGEAEPARPNIKAIVVTDLTDETHGNAVGIGLADVITRRLYEKIDFPATYENAYTSTFLERAKVPMVAANAEEAMDYAIRSCGPVEPDQLRIVRIRDTLQLDQAHVSRAILDDLRAPDDIEVIAEDVALLDPRGELTPF